MEVAGLFIFFILIAVILRIGAGSLDGDRVERYLAEQGWELLDKSWDPLGPGWFGEKNARIYKIAYRDRDGRIHEAHVKTSMLSGVYLTHDRIVNPAKGVDAASPSLSSLPLREPGLGMHCGSASAASTAASRYTRNAPATPATPVTPDPDPAMDADALAEENRRLRRRIKELENRTP